MHFNQESKKFLLSLLIGILMSLSIRIPCKFFATQLDIPWFFYLIYILSLLLGNTIILYIIGVEDIKFSSLIFRVSYSIALVISLSSFLGNEVSFTIFQGEVREILSICFCVLFLLYDNREFVVCPTDKGLNTGYFWFSSDTSNNTWSSKSTSGTDRDCSTGCSGNGSGSNNSNPGAVSSKDNVKGPLTREETSTNTLTDLISSYEDRSDNDLASKDEYLPSTTYNPDKSGLVPNTSSTNKTTGISREISNNSLVSNSSSTPSINTLAKNLDEAVKSGNVKPEKGQITVKKDFKNKKKKDKKKENWVSLHR